MIAGSTYTVGFVINQKDGSPLNLDNILGMLIAIYTDPTKIVGKFTLVPQSGWDTIEVTDGPNGECQVYLTTEHTTEFLKRQCKADIKVIVTNNKFPNNQGVLNARGLSLEIVESTILEHQTVPV